MPLTAKKPGLKTEAPARIETVTQVVEAAEPQPVAPKVTAIVFSYNDAAGLRRCITALEQSKDSDVIEILVVDSGSQDESPRIDSEFPRVTVLRLPRYFGRTKALNIATRTAAAEFLFYLTTEVEVLPNTIPILSARLEADDTAAAVCPLLTDSQGNPAPQFFRLPTPNTGTELIAVDVDRTLESIPVDYVTFHALLVRKYFIRGLNYLDERYGEYWSDAEFSYQVQRASKCIYVLPHANALYTPATVASSSAARTVRASDRALGAAAFFGKHYGFFAGLMFRVRTTLMALLTLRFGLFTALLTGQKIDGSQSAVL